jgi:secreted trypsin-like serine protease
MSVEDLTSGVGLRYGDEAGAQHAGRYLLALVFATLLALGAAVPVFAAEEPAGEDEAIFQPQVVGGDSVPGGKYKFMATLRDVTRGNTVYQQHFCGGTLIDRNSVLTTAHCVQGVTPLRLRVTVGRTVLKSSQGQSRRVTAVFLHPGYKGIRNMAYDAAVLTLKRRVKNIAPVSIPQPEDNALETPDSSATIAGWGNTEKQSPNGGQPDRYPNRMQEAQVPIVSDTTAKNIYDAEYRQALMVAAGERGKDTCQGDSGGPIFVDDGAGRASQIGITSFGIGCGANGYPGVYAEANNENIRDFIYTAAEN